jgi:hypothetical protein
MEKGFDKKGTTQETLEEVAERYASQFIKGKIVYHGFIEGAEWMQERMYSEEDMRKAFIEGGNSQIEEDDDYGTEYDAYMEDWFENFKKNSKNHITMNDVIFENGKLNVDRSSYTFKMISYHLSHICHEIINQDDDKAESSGTTHIKKSLEFQYLMGSLEDILEGLDTLAIKIYNTISTEVLEGYDETIYDYVYDEFLISYQ